jgi:hypothetical protein
MVLYRIKEVTMLLASMIPLAACAFPSPEPLIIGNPGNGYEQYLFCVDDDDLGNRVMGG